MLKKTLVKEIALRLLQISSKEWLLVIMLKLEVVIYIYIYIYLKYHTFEIKVFCKFMRYVYGINLGISNFLFE